MPRRIPFGARVARVRRRFDETQVEFAERLGVHVLTLARWEKLIDQPVSREVQTFLELEEAEVGGGHNAVASS